MATHLLIVRGLSADVAVYVVRDIVFNLYKLTVIYLEIFGLLDQ